MCKVYILFIKVGDVCEAVLGTVNHLRRFLFLRLQENVTQEFSAVPFGQKCRRLTY